MVDPLFVRLHVAVQERAVRGMPSLCAVSWTWSRISGLSLPGATRRRTRGGEDLGAAAGQRPETGRLELAQDLPVREPGERRHVVDLGRRVQLEMYVGKRVVQCGRRVAVEVEVHVRVFPVDRLSR